MEQRGFGVGGAATTAATHAIWRFTWTEGQRPHLRRGDCQMSCQRRAEAELRDTTGAESTRNEEWRYVALRQSLRAPSMTRCHAVAARRQGCAFACAPHESVHRKHMGHQYSALATA